MPQTHALTLLQGVYADLALMGSDPSMANVRRRMLEAMNLLQRNAEMTVHVRLDAETRADLETVIRNAVSDGMGSGLRR